MPSPQIHAARKLKELLIRSSPIIEELTAAVCSGCADVCCKQKHGTYRERDVVYLNALGVARPLSDHAGPPEAPCGFLETGGCVLPRWLRPFKCTWYFCGPLLTAMHGGPSRKMRRLSAVMQEMISLYDALT
jgi:hypothetical protein